MEKEYKQPQFLRELIPELDVEKDITFTATATKLAYANEIIFVIAASAVLINILVSNKQVLKITHAIRATVLFLVAGLSIMAISRGHSIPSVNIYFYLVECLIIVSIMLAGLVLESIKESKSWMSIGLMTGFVLVNGYFLTKTLYRLQQLAILLFFFDYFYIFCTHYFYA